MYIGGISCRAVAIRDPAMGVLNLRIVTVSCCAKARANKFAVRASSSYRFCPAHPMTRTKSPNGANRARMYGMSKCIAAALCVSAIVTIACSDAPHPLASHELARQSVADSIPYAAGVHVAALPGLTNLVSSITFPINDFGEVVGEYQTGATTPSMAFKYQTQRGLRALALPNTTGAGVNNQGLVAIGILTDSGNAVGTWDWFGNVRVFRNLSTLDCFPAGINNSNVVVGSCSVRSVPGLIATTWSPHGTPNALHPGGGAAFIQAQAFAISDSGYIAGGPDNNGSPFVFTPTGQERLLPTAGAAPTFNSATAVNNHGWAAGTLSGPCAVGYRAVAWIADTLDDIGVCGIAYDIDDNGVVVGTVQTASEQFPFVWDVKNGLRRLPGLFAGDESGIAGRINHNHQVTGLMYANGNQYTVVWTLPPQ